MTPRDGRRLTAQEGSAATPAQGRVRALGVQLAVVAAGLAVNVVVARGWGPEQRGLLATVMVVTSLITYAGGLGLPDAVVRLQVQGLAPALLAGWFRYSSLCVLCLAALAAPALLVVLPDAPGWLPWLVVVEAIALHAVRTSGSVALADARWLLFDLLRVGQPAGFALLLVALLASGHTEVGVVVPLVAAHAVLALGGAVAVPVLRTGWRPARPSRDALRLGLQSSGGNLLQTALVRVDVLLVVALAGPGEAGVYALALSVAEAALFAATAFSYQALRAASTGSSTGTLTAVSVAVAGALSLLAVPVLHLLGPALYGPLFPTLPTVVLALTPGTMALAALRIGFATGVGSGRATPAVAALGAALALQVALDLAILSWRPTAVWAAAACSAAYVVGTLSLLLVTRRRAR